MATFDPDPTDKNIRFKSGDQVVCYENVEIIRTVDWSPEGF